MKRGRTKGFTLIELMIVVAIIAIIAIIAIPSLRESWGKAKEAAPPQQAAPENPAPAGGSGGN